jgi:AcrR family transcriptional regulator
VPKVSAEHKEAVRERLLEAARRCLTRKGYEGTTTRDIAAEAGVAIGTLYNYFASKEDLIEALSEHVLSADLTNLGTADGPVDPASLVALLRDFVFAQPGSGTPVLAQLRGRVSTDANPAVARFNEYIAGNFLPLVKEAQAAGVVREDLDTEALIELVDLLWDGMTRRHAGKTFTTSYERVGALAMELLTKGALG